MKTNYTKKSELPNTFEQEETKKKSLINELKDGEKSGKISNFDLNKNLEMVKANFEK